MSVDVSFAIAPHGLEEVISAMTATVAAVPYDTFATKWGKVAVCLRDARFLATVRDRRVLSRMEALIDLGVSHATALDVPPHPKIPGYCLVRAHDRVDAEPCRWTFLMESDDWFQKECIACRKALSTLAWHFSMKNNRAREFEWSRRASELVQKMLRQWRYERKGRLSFEASEAGSALVRGLTADERE